MIIVTGGAGFIGSNIVKALNERGRNDILIVDEVLSVGDYRFKEKCTKRIKEMIDQGTTIIIVSHEIDLIEEVCNKVLWLDHGKVKGLGNTDEICEAYKVS